MAETKYEHVPVSDLQKYDNGAGVQPEEDEDKAPGPSSPAGVGFIQLFRFADCLERFLVALGIVVAWAAGLCMPFMIILFGRFANALVRYGATKKLVQCLADFALGHHNGTTLSSWMDNGTTSWTDNGTTSGMDNATTGNDNSSVWWPATANPGQQNHSFGDGGAAELQKENVIYVVGLTLVGVAQLVLGYVMVTCLNVAAERQVHRIRSLFLKSTLRQDVAWFDTQQAGDFASRSAEGLTKLQDGIGEKLGMFHFFMGTFVFNVVNAFVHGWKLTLVILSVTPVMVVATAILSKVQTSVTEDELKAYSRAGSVAQEVITAVRTVVSFGGEVKEVQRYDAKLEHASKSGIRRGLVTAAGSSTFYFMIYASYALAFWYGVKLIVDQHGQPEPEYDPSTMIIVFFSVLMGAMNMGQTAPYIEAFSQAKAAAGILYDVIDRIPPIDSSSQSGLRPKEMTGDVEFDSVDFCYPSRPEVQVLDGLTLAVGKGQTVALVGESGCGKSTIVQLLLRFYDPLRGSVRVDGNDIRTLNLGWLRDNIGIVGQEPVLFSTTIAENIKYGLEGATRADVERAAKEANAHDFIMKFPQKYDTLVGSRGAQLSGGQKQRVAIARALIRNPKILLLDEATSALDSESESVVQQALDKARLGRTTIVVAHRLSTVRNADKIAVMSKGQVVELGTHQELMARAGIYHAMVTAQSGGDSNLALSNHSLDAALTNSAASPAELGSAENLNHGRGPFLRQRTLSTGTETQAEDQDVDQVAVKIPSAPLGKLLRLCRQEWHLVVLGCLGAFGMGLGIPAYAIVFGDILSVLSHCDQNKIMEDTIFYVCMFLVIGVASAAFNFLQIFMFSYSGEALTRRLRRMTFAAMLKQDMGWFDDPKNSVGSLCTKLSSDASNVQGAAGSKIGVILQSVCTLTVSSVTALFLSWKMALVGMSSIPFVLASAYIQCMIILGQSVVEMKSLDKANKIAVEVISNVRTVASLHNEEAFHGMYMQHLAEPHRKALRNTHFRGMVFGFAQSTPFFTYGICMYYGGVLVLNEGLDYGVAFQIAELLILGTMMVGQAFAFAPNANKGAVSAARIFEVLERTPEIDTSADSGCALKEDSAGRLAFRLVSFHYPTRANVPVLRELNLEVEPGKVLALVGSSGCGKSTCVQLLERFYDPVSGCMTMDDTDITKLRVPWLRSRIGVVSQEPMLFDRSIADNIAYGDNSRQVPMDEIVKAATEANIHQFIVALPQGYETSVGDKGTLLSGGQKQRIAIARALVRNPKILLLDEATSALDTESEKVVQEALERAQRGRTCIVVAHRLSTVRDADQIAVIHQGKVAEKGSHEELMEARGHYYRFYQMQAKGAI